MSTLKKTKRLLKVVHELRKKCPWDKKQTHRTLIPYLIEEAYETVDAIESKSKVAMKEELGDVLLQVVLHAEIAAQKKQFTFEDIADGITEKMIHRHPHIFKKQKYKGLKEHLQNWERMKKEEKPDRLMLDGIPKALPSLQLSQRYGEIAASVGFDWPNIAGVLEKVEEEFGELKDEMVAKPINKDALEMEMGDLFFTLTRLSAHLGLDAERCVRRSAEKFKMRFSELERKKKALGKALPEFSLEELEEEWKKIKNESAHS